MGADRHAAHLSAFSSPEPPRACGRRVADNRATVDGGALALIVGPTFTIMSGPTKQSLVSLNLDLSGSTFTRNRADGAGEFACLSAAASGLGDGQGRAARQHLARQVEGAGCLELDALGARALEYLMQGALACLLQPACLPAWPG